MAAAACAAPWRRSSRAASAACAASGHRAAPRGAQRCWRAPHVILYPCNQNSRTLCAAKVMGLHARRLCSERARAAEWRREAAPPCMAVGGKVKPAGWRAASKILFTPSLGQYAGRSGARARGEGVCTRRVQGACSSQPAPACRRSTRFGQGSSRKTESKRKYARFTAGPMIFFCVSPLSSREAREKPQLRDARLAPHSDAPHTYHTHRHAHDTRKAPEAPLADQTK